MEVSVALCTYNGERYLRPQLDSILAQSRPPDEIRVRDDGSTDGTVGLLREYESAHPELFSVHENDENLGADENFSRCLADCTGDVIAVCDQDDIWEERKLERGLAAFEDASAGVVFHNATVVSESLEPITDFWSTLCPPYVHGTVRDSTGAYEGLVKRNAIQGAAMLLDADLREHVLPVPDHWPYDHFIAMMALVVSGLHDIDEELMAYRQHGGQAIGAETTGGGLVRALAKVRRGEKHPNEHFEDVHEKWRLFGQRVRALDEETLSIDRETALEPVETQLRYLEYRMTVLDESVGRRRRLAALLRALRTGGYSRFGNGLWSVLSDVTTVAPV